MSEAALPIAVLISGGGTTLKNLIDLQQSGSLKVDFRLVISSRRDAGGLRFAEDAKIPSCVLAKKSFATQEAYRDEAFRCIEASGAKLVVMGGFLLHLLIPERWTNRVVNIHPSLIPSFCGEGYYGLKVHQAALDYGVKVSGCTVHFVDNQYDHGPVILQRTCPVLEGDTPESLQARVFAEECKALPDAIELIRRGRVEVDPTNRRVAIR